MVGADRGYVDLAFWIDHQRNSLKIPEKRATAFRAVAFIPIYLCILAPAPYFGFKLFNPFILFGSHFFISLPTVILCAALVKRRVAHSSPVLA